MNETNSKKISRKIGFIGGGNLAKAICKGIVSNGLVTFGQICVSGPRLENLSWWANNDCKVSQLNQNVVNEADIIFICVKPHILNEVVSGLGDYGDYTLNQLYVSVLAGTSLKTLSQKLGHLSPRIIRIMPNTAMVVGEGCTLLSASSSVLDGDKEIVNKLMSSVGLCKEVPEEYMDHLGALTSSGTAFIYMVLEALADGAVKMGIPRALATEMAAQMTLGAGKMARDAGKHTGQLKDEVCSPAGTSIQGVLALEKRAIRAAFIEAIEVTAKRCEEIQVENDRKI